MNGSLPVRHWLPAVVCLSPLVPVLLVPGFGALLSLLIVVIALAVFKGSRGPTLAMVWRSAWLSILVGVVAGAALSVATAELVRPLVEGWLGRDVDIGPLKAVAGNKANFAVIMAVAVLFGGLMEELVFRGFVIGWGTKLFGARAGFPLMLLSAAVFGLAHEYGPAGAVVTGLLGFALGALYLATDRKLLPAMTAHTTFNIIGASALFLA